MIVNVCCSGSSGSTFFSYILNGHPDIVCGDELSLFSKPVFYEDYGHLKRWHRLIKRFGISSNPFFQDRAILVNLGSYMLRPADIWGLVVQSRDLIDFASKFESLILDIADKRIWAEKTPTNIFMAGRFLDLFPEGKVIHLVRDPRDVVLSLLSRGHSVLSAAEVWLAAVSSIQNQRARERVLEIRYEDLILKSEEVLEKVCRHLDIPFNMSYFLEKDHQTRKIKRSEGMEGWKNRPSMGFSSASIGRYRTTTVDLNEIFTVTLNERFASILGVPPWSLVELAETYGYVFNLPKEAMRHRGRPVLPEDRRGPLSKMADVFVEKQGDLVRTVY